MIYSAKQPPTHLIFSKSITVSPCSPSQLQAWVPSPGTPTRDRCTWLGALHRPQQLLPNLHRCNFKNAKSKISEAPSKTNSSDLLQSHEVKASCPSLTTLIKINIAVASVTFLREKSHPLDPPLQRELPRERGHGVSFPTAG